MTHSSFGTTSPGGLASVLGATSERTIAVELPRSGREVNVRAFQREERRWIGARPANFGLVPNKVGVEFHGQMVYPEFAIVRRFEQAGWGAVWCKNWHGRAFWTDIGIIGVVPSAVQSAFDAITKRAGAGAWDILAWNGNQVAFIESKQYGSDKLTLNQRTWLEAALDHGVSMDAFAVHEYIV